jgi:hypothetical protein
MYTEIDNFLFPQEYYLDELLQEIQKVFKIKIEEKAYATLIYDESAIMEVIDLVACIEHYSKKVKR